ncbi:hypothetical protein TrVGV298_011092 [Trichoderma virens]|nr:hypothetical protein TrVGV298_011092 [Trichoderma virens]
MVQSPLEDGIIACTGRIRECISACSAAEFQCASLASQIAEMPALSTTDHLEAELRLQDEIKATHAKTGLQAQIELLQLVKSSGWTTTRMSVTKALWEIFPVSQDDIEARNRFEVDRRASISRTGKLLGVENPNALRLPGRQIRRRAQAPTPVARTPTLVFPPKHSLPQLDSPTPKRAREDEPKAFNLPTPTTVPRQSSRLSTIPSPDYSIARAFSALDAEEPALQETAQSEDISVACNEYVDSDEAFEWLEEESESDDAFDDWQEELLDNIDVEGLEQNESRTLADNRHAAASTVLVPFVDEDGLTRIGTQPMKPALYIGWAPKKEACSRIRNRVLCLWNMIDRKFIVTVPVNHNAEIKAIEDRITGSLSKYADDDTKVIRRCDYTGVEMSWAAGPQSWSIEAIYPYIVSNRRVAYHAAQNVSVVSTSLNWAKGEGCAGFVASSCHLAKRL